MRPIAATRLIPLHINKGKTIAQTLNDRTDYAQEPGKNGEGGLVTAYECDPFTVDEEFMLSKRQYEHSAGRRQKHDVIAYQIRQSFKPGEVTVEEVNQIGYELAMRFTKGEHAFIVATHTDRPHIHNHIIFNSTTLDGSRKFKNFFLSYLAIQKISDRLCIQHGLSIVEPKPYREREKRTDYPKNTSFRDGICETIDAILQHVFSTPKCRKLQRKNVGCCNCKAVWAAIRSGLYHADIFCQNAGYPVKVAVKLASAYSTQRGIA